MQGGAAGLSVRSGRQSPLDLVARQENLEVGTNEPHAPGSAHEDHEQFDGDQQLLE